MNLPDGEYPIDLSNLRNNPHKILQLKFSSSTNSGSPLDRIDSTKFEIVGNRSSKNYYIYSDDTSNSGGNANNTDFLMEVSNLKSKDSEFILVLNKEKQLSLVKLSNIIRVNKSRISKKTHSEIIKIRSGVHDNGSDTNPSDPKPTTKKSSYASRRSTPGAIAVTAAATATAINKKNIKSKNSVIDDPWLNVDAKQASKERRLKKKNNNNNNNNTRNLVKSSGPVLKKNEVEIFEDDFNFDNFDQFDDDLSNNNDIEVNIDNGNGITNNEDDKKGTTKEEFSTNKSVASDSNIKKDDDVSDGDLSFEDELEEELNEVLGNEYEDDEDNDEDIPMEIHLDNDNNTNDDDYYDDTVDIGGLEVVDDPLAHKRQSNTTTTSNGGNTRSTVRGRTASKKAPTNTVTSKSSVVQTNGKSTSSTGADGLSDIELSLEEEQEDDDDLEDIDLEEEISSEEE